MTEAVDNACNEIVAILRNVPGIQNVPINPPSVMSYATFGLVYPFTGYFDAAPAGTNEGVHNIAIDILTKDIDIAKSLKTLKPLIDTVSLAFIRQVAYDSNGNPGQAFNNSIETFIRLSYMWIPLTDYGGVPVVGFRFLMEGAKIHTNL